MSDLTSFMAEVMDIWTQTVKTPFADRRPTQTELDIFADRILQLVQEEKSYGTNSKANTNA